MIMKKYVMICASVMFLFACAADQNSNKNQAKKVEGQTAQLPATKTVQTGSLSNSKSEGHNTGGLEWMSIEQALAANEKAPKMILIDVYTDWCGWCKVMDRKTFTDPAVQDYIRENFYAVKFDAEQKESIQFGGREYKFVPGKRRGHNQLAAHLLNGRLGYPSFAYLNSDLSHMHVSAGFKKPDQFLAEMKNVVSSKS